MKKSHGMIVLVLLLGILPVALTAQVYDGLTLYGSQGSRSTYLINNSGQNVHTWTSSYSCAYMSYMLPDSTLWRGDVNSGATMRGPAYGGKMQHYDWNGNIIHSFLWSNAYHQQHHDHHVMPNGNVLLIAWDRKTAAQARELGRTNITGDIWPDEAIEYDPVGDSVVWEWHFWDHLIQDADPAKPNYGVVAEHPELLDINLGNVQGGDWMHCNTIDYNEERDEIILTSHNLHELFVIDHSTTTEEAAGHTGGRSGKGGDFLYRWGNPQNYDRGTTADRVFYVVHGGNWIRPGMPGAGDIIVLNNGDRSGSANDYSVATQITPPLDSLGNYHIAPDSAFGPRALTWSFQNGSAFYSQHLGGAYRLENGNTFAILGTTGTVKEITPDGQIVWTRSLGGQLGRAFKYPVNFATGLKSNPETAVTGPLLAAGPNPFTNHLSLNYRLTARSRVRLAVHDRTGRLVRELSGGIRETGVHTASFQPDAALPAGVYLVRLETVPTDANYSPARVTRAVVKGN